MTTQAPAKNMLPLNPEKLDLLNSIIDDCSLPHLTWIAGYLWGIIHQTEETKLYPIKKETHIPTITILSASQTGNARRLSEQLYETLDLEKFQSHLINTSDYQFKKINQEQILVLITSTQGNGEPPEEAVALYKFLMSNKAPNMNTCSFAVFGLGDTSYELFNQAGKDFDRRLEELGATRLLNRVDADVEFSDQACSWRTQLVKILQEHITSNTSQVTNTNIKNINSINNTLYTKDTPLRAHLLVNQKITGRNSNQDVRHIELDLGESNLRYQPGDSLGVWFENDPELVQELMDLTCLSIDDKVIVNDNLISIQEALKKHYELTINTTQIIKKYAELAQNNHLMTKLDTQEKLQQYAKNTPIIEMIRVTPVKLNSQKLINILRPISPRLYSISSAQEENEKEVHITVSVVRFNIDGRARSGGASSYLADRLHENDEIRIFVEQNNNFRLPVDPNKPIIMIGPGTGIAPFRAFMQKRNSEKASGKNWLFFGNPHFTEDFLYQIEWQRYVKNGILTHIDLAWSRDQKKKIYVQDKIYDKGEEVWRWIQDGAYLYVCGNASHMAKDVEKVLLKVITEFGKMDLTTADEFLNNLRIEHRYQRDVY
ncbi:NADPH-dependent assimilatory sulfite reductase flavoprotein subunit [Candidatus Erwinia haradaeae]|uniref:Sulfite reductase [NADPH] flavoprotein alpha-component n=1 Tax=Candidatus Erwinia haradaeae TaxID=1922217 RepID=A0A803FUJ0_9GAMM|nr:NADPH-dependent assimilatory sulfite reductase flavoprotein subunit [Candidatus Erwinia haradaeae]VFP88777.1 Sulfite reductase [NADPH] flavoprotein alpha-component [Candidatus Erwinia haradaeae]